MAKDINHYAEDKNFADKKRRDLEENRTKVAVLQDQVNQKLELNF